MYRAFETIEYMIIACRNYFKRKIIIVAANLALCHLDLLKCRDVVQKTP